MRTYILKNQAVAAPHATGVAALLWSKDINLTNQNVRDLLDRSAVGLGDKKSYGNGLVNAQYAMKSYDDFAKNGKKGEIPKNKKQKFPGSDNLKKSVDPIVTATGTVEAYYVNSPHPYPDNYYNTWTITKSGASNIRVHFSYIEVETNWDYVTTDAGNTWTGSHYGVWSNWSGSSSITVRLSSDGSIVDDGFQIDQIEYTLPVDDHSNDMNYATSILVGPTYSGNIDYVGDVDFFRFTPTVSGNHIIESTGSSDTYGYLYNSSGTQIDYDDDDGEAYNFAIPWNLTADQTYYIKVKYYQDSGTGAYGLKVTAPTTVTDDHANDRNSLATTIIYNSSRSGIINYAGDIDYFKFTPTVSKSYVFKSTGFTDTYGFLFDSDLFIRENDDYGSLNFTITQYLIAGRTYYLGVRHYSPTRTGDYSILVTDAILGDESYNRQFTVEPYQASGRAGFDQIISDVDNYGSQLDDFGSNNVTSFNSLVSNIVKIVGSVQDRVMHFARNKINRAPSSLQGMVDYINANPGKKWRMLPVSESLFHMNDGEVYNIKFVSPDEHFEAVYNTQTMLLVDSPSNMGTYNFVGPIDKPNHTTYDVNPYFQYGNTESQNINRTLIEGAGVEGAKAGANSILFYGNLIATWWFDTYYNLYK